MTRPLPDHPPEQPQEPGQPAASEQPADDTLDEIRQDLKAADQQEQAAKKSGWLARLTGRLHLEKQPQQPDEPTAASPPPAAGELAAEPAPAAPAGEPAPKPLAFDIEVEEVAWSPPEEEAEEPIDDDLFSSRLEQFTPAEAEAGFSEEPFTHTPDPDPPGGETPPPPGPDHAITPFVFDDPVESEIDFNAPLPPLEDASKPWEAETDTEPTPDADAAASLPFMLADEGPPDRPAQEAPFAIEETPPQPDVEPTDTPAKSGLLKRIFPFRRTENEPDRYTMNDEVVTGRLQLANTMSEDRADAPAREKKPADQAGPPSKPAGPRPFWDGVSEGDAADDDHPQTEEEFWEALARKERDQDPLFRSQQMNWAAFEAPPTPPAERTTPFDNQLDEEWPGEGPSTPGDRDSDLQRRALPAGSEETGAVCDVIPVRTPYSDGEPAEQLEPEVSDELVEADYRQTILSASPADQSAVDVGELRSIALEDYEDQPASAGGGRNRLARWLAARRVALLVSALVICSLAAIVMIAWPLVMRQAAAQPAAATATVDPAALPYPVGLRLTGGWFFNLQKGQLTEGTWNPTSGEWLEGTELRRVIALPWNRQLKAVIGSLLPGDEMLLHMSNNDVLTYAVESVEQVTRSERDLLSGTDPSLLIVLVDPESDLRWVVLCTPAGSVNSLR